MITYYGYTISPNQLETGEGFLICRNVPIARTGTQDYLGTEVGKDTQDIAGSVSTPSTSTGSVLWAECSAGSASQREEGGGILEVVLAQPGPQPGLVPVPLNEESGAQH